MKWLLLAKKEGTMRDRLRQLARVTESRRTSNAVLSHLPCKRAFQWFMAMTRRGTSRRRWSAIAGSHAWAAHIISRTRVDNFLRERFHFNIMGLRYSHDAFVTVQLLGLIASGVYLSTEQRTAKHKDGKLVAKRLEHQRSTLRLLVATKQCVSRV